MFHMLPKLHQGCEFQSLANRSIVRLVKLQILLHATCYSLGHTSILPGARAQHDLLSCQASAPFRVFLNDNLKGILPPIKEAHFQQM